MDVIITAVGEFIWASSCGIVNFCLGSGVSALVIFVSFLCTILASAFYKYSISRERILLNDTTAALTDDDDGDQSATATSSTTKPSIRSPSSFVIMTNPIDIDRTDSLSELDIFLDQNTSDNEENDEETLNNMIIDTTEDSEEEI